MFVVYYFCMGICVCCILSRALLKSSSIEMMYIVSLQIIKSFITSCHKNVITLCIIFERIYNELGRIKKLPQNTKVVTCHCAHDVGCT